MPYSFLVFSLKKSEKTEALGKLWIQKLYIFCIFFNFCRRALHQATRVQTPAGAFGKRIGGKNRSVQEGLDMKIVAGLD